MPVGPTPLWDDPGANAQLRRLADAPKLTLIVGAGASAEAGFPLWAELVRRLVRAGVENIFATMGASDQDELVRSITNLGPTAAASYAQALLEGKFYHELVKCLYSRVDAPMLPGPTAIAAAKLFMTLGEDSELVTLNYDDQLYLALESEAANKGLTKAVISGRPRHAREHLIRHIHGKAHANETPSPLILTEADYFGVSASKLRWAADFMRARLDDGIALFIGTSLNDPNLLRYLHSQRSISGSPKHLAIFRRSSPSSSMSVAAFEDATSVKWKQVGVATVQSDFYSQNAQFLHELRLARTLGSAYVPYADRLRRWSEDMASDWLHDLSSQETFGNNQEIVQAALLNLIENLVKLCAADSIFLKGDETLDAELWSRRPSSRSLTLLGTTAMTYREVATMPSVSLLNDANDPIVASFQSGVRMLHELGQSSSRTRTMMTIPVVHEDSTRYGRLSVGVLTLRSNHPLTNVLLAAPPIRSGSRDRAAGGSRLAGSRSTRSDTRYDTIGLPGYDGGLRWNPI